MVRVDQERRGPATSVHREPRSGCLVVDSPQALPRPRFASLKVLLPLRVRLAEVVPEPRPVEKFPGTEGRAKFAGELGDILKMVEQSLTLSTGVS